MLENFLIFYLFIIFLLIYLFKFENFLEEIYWRNYLLKLRILRNTDLLHFNFLKMENGNRLL
jgi:hypothetical protein